MGFVENLPPEVLLLALLPVLRGDDPLASTTLAAEVSTTKVHTPGVFLLAERVGDVLPYGGK